MNFVTRPRAQALAGAAIAALALPALAQTSSTDPNASGVGSGSAGSTAAGSTASSRGSDGSMSASGSAYGRDSAYSLLPYTRRGYVGINLGKPEYKTGCGSGGYNCDDPDVSGYFYTGGLVNDWFGVEVGYLNTGRAERAGGRTRGEGLNLSVVGRVPVGAFNVFAKAGGIYGQTRVSTGPLSDVTSGKRRGWGGSYGAGVGFDFTPNSGVVLEWNRYQFLFPGRDGREDVDITSLGYVYRF